MCDIEPKTQAAPEPEPDDGGWSAHEMALLYEQDLQGAD